MKKRTILITILLVVSLALSACDALGSGSKKSSKKSTKVEKEDDEDDEKKDKKGKKGSSEEDIDEWKEEASEAAISDFLELMSDETYMDAVLPHLDEASDKINACGDAKIVDDKVYVVDLSEDVIVNVFEVSSGDSFDYSALSNAGKERMATSLASTLTIASSRKLGMEYITALSIMNASKSFAVDYDFDDQLWVYDTDVLDFAITVYFHNNHEGVVTVTVSGYFYEGDLVYDLEDTLDEFGLSYDIVEK